MKTKPSLQVALDYVSLPSAIAMAVHVHNEVDIIEVGTPLCKAAGIDAVEAMVEVCPETPVLADFKTPDVGGLEAEMAFDAGAQYMSVIGGAPLATVEAASEVAEERGREILIELTGVRNPLERAGEWADIGIERLVYHRGWDEEAADRDWKGEDLELIESLEEMGFKMTVTGGLTAETIPRFSQLSPSILVCGRAIHQADDPESAARTLQNVIRETWN